MAGTETSFGVPERVEPGGTVGLQRGAAAVCIPVYGSHDLFTQCLLSVLQHTPPGVAVLIADDASIDPASKRFLDEVTASGFLSHRLIYLRQPQNVGFV